MATFKDAEGREWVIRLTLGSIDRVKREADVDFGVINTPEGPRKLAAMFDNPATLAKVCYVLAHSQAEKAGVSPEQFAEAIDGDTLERMGEALNDEIVNFSPTHRRDVMRAGLKKAQGTIQRAAAKAVEAIEAMSDEAIASVLATGGLTATASADTPEPTPTAEP